jgi:hypothetical protein
LDYYGILVFFAGLLDPVFIYLGLPGSTAIVFITSIFLPLYAPLAIITSMSITLRELTILALMCQNISQSSGRKCYSGEDRNTLLDCHYFADHNECCRRVVVESDPAAGYGNPVFWCRQT